MNDKFDFYNSTNIKSYNLDDSIRYQLKQLDGLDAYTRRHTDNVANITCRLCENLHLSKDFTVYTTICAYLHDIGKIFIPPSVLQKPSKLTDEEFEIMKTHTTIGYKMCMNDPKLRPYSVGPLYHHEALNGLGYPNGVKKQDIPYEAQIIRVADEFEAITAKRQYKSHIGIVDALNIVIENATPMPPKTLGEGVKNIGNMKYGKNNPKIVRQLFRVVIDDTEYEISAKMSYIDFLKDEIKRMHYAMKFYDKMVRAHSPEKREYHKQEVKYCLKAQEDPEKVPQMLKEFEEAIKVREADIKKLYSEVKQIKHLKV